MARLLERDRVVHVDERLALSRRSLDGLSVGDAFGERFFMPADAALEMIEARALPAAPWCYTDDTVMALSIYEVLRDRGQVDADRLARAFGRRYQEDRMRGYGAAAHGMLTALARGESWRQVATAVFGGTGSMGNGAAMRVAPVGAYFFDAPERAATEARRSAEVTHAHPEGIAGAIAVACAAAWAARGGGPPAALFEAALLHTPAGPTRDGVEAAAALSLDAELGVAIEALGNGSRILAQDTVPLCLWSAARHLTSYEQAMWGTVAALGDRDTTCAIVGGLVALTSTTPIPEAWIAAREPLPL